MSLKASRRSLYRKIPAVNSLFYGLRRRGVAIDIALKSMYYSQYGQDRLLAEVLFKDKHKGFFIDIGANDGVSLSNTYYLEKMLQWQGICVEPQPGIYEQLVKNRTSKLYQNCVSDKAGTVDFLHVPGGANMLSGIVNQLDDRHKERIRLESGLSGEEKIIPVVCKTFADIAQGVTFIDYLSIDTEGAELSILKCIDFSKYRIACVSVENNYQEYAIPRLMMSRGYQLFATVGDDEFYVRPDLMIVPEFSLTREIS